MQIPEKKGWMRKKRIECPKCKRSKYKIVHTHGMKSHGYKVCKHCKSIIR